MNSRDKSKIGENRSTGISREVGIFRGAEVTTELKDPKTEHAPGSKTAVGKMIVLDIGGGVLFAANPGACDHQNAVAGFHEGPKRPEDVH